jgi:hypothetical protein
MEFQDGKRDAIVEGAPGRRGRSPSHGPDQGELF